jgi:hypothetical protein
MKHGLVKFCLLIGYVNSMSFPTFEVLTKEVHIAHSSLTDAFFHQMLVLTKEYHPSLKVSCEDSLFVPSMEHIPLFMKKKIKVCMLPQRHHNFVLCLTIQLIAMTLSFLSVDS